MGYSVLRYKCKDLEEHIIGMHMRVVSTASTAFMRVAGLTNDEYFKYTGRYAMESDIAGYESISWK